MPKKTLLLILLLATLLGSSFPVFAQSSGPVYIVQPGDSLSSIAARFDVTVEDLMRANDITDPNLLAAGQELVVPGLEGFSGVLDTTYINFGDTYAGLLRRTQIPAELLRRLNRLVSPSEFYVGASMIVPRGELPQQPSSPLALSAGESLLELAVRSKSDVWSLGGANQLEGTWQALPGDVLYGPQEAASIQGVSLAGVLASTTIRNLPLKQGGTAVIEIAAEPAIRLGGTLIDRELQFVRGEAGKQYALQGMHALLEPGVYPLRLDAVLPDGSEQSFEQMVVINSGGYIPEVIAVNDPATIDPAVSEAEAAQVLALVSAVAEAKAWAGTFQLPVAEPGLGCIKDWFGRPRTYTVVGSELTLAGFHSGVDFGICSETHPFDIYAPAPGQVVFAGPLTVRGNATVINHGWGVYTGYWHQDQVLVAVGDAVQTGQLIGKIGATGRVTGPHLHWELFANGVQVEPLDWLAQEYP